MLLAPSHHIRPRQAREILRAARHSFRIGRPLNWHATIDFGWVEQGDELEPSRTMRDIRRRLCSWWDYKKKRGVVQGPICDTVIWEAPNGQHHANWLLHIPDHLKAEVESVIGKRLRKVMGDVPDDTLHQQPIFNLNGLVAYLLKGTEPNYATKIEIRPVYQGTVWFRRAVPSMSLGRAARERDWLAGQIVNANQTRGLPFPREKRVMDAERGKYC